MVGHGELTERAWARIAPFLPKNDGRGSSGGTIARSSTASCGSCAPARRGATAPRRYGPWQTCYDRFVRWRRDGTWDASSPRSRRRPTPRASRLDGLIDATSSAPTSTPPAPAAARAAADEKGGRRHPADEALGRSRGGLTTKMHLACDGRGRPLSIVVHGRAAPREHAAGAGAGRHPRAAAERAGPPPQAAGPPDRRQGYSYPRCRRLLRRRGIPHTIPERRDQQASGAPRGRVARCGSTGSAYARRSVVERCVTG